MEEQLLAKSTLAGVPPIEASRLTAAPQLLSLVTRLLTWAALSAVVGGGLFLRLYRMDGVITYYPDSYAQQQAVENLLSGTFPISFLYPPGIALFLAPFFAFLPNTLMTIQMAIVTSGVALIVVAYLASHAVTGDRRAALFSAVAVAIGATFVFYSRVIFFDVVNTLLIVLALFLAPLAVRRGAWAVLPYAVLVFATVTVRYTNLVVLPGLFLASLHGTSRSLSWRALLDHLRSPPVLTVGLTIAALYVAYAAASLDSFTRFTSSESGSVVDFSTYLPRLGQHLMATLTGYGEELHWQDGAVAVSVLALAVVGAHRLWQTNRGMLIPMAYVLLVWSPVHSIYMLFASRRLMPPFFLVLLLAALGLSVALERWRSLDRAWQRVALAGLLACGVTFFAARQLALDTLTLHEWPANVAASREKAYDDLRPFLTTLDGPNSVLVSSQSLAVDRATPGIIDYDLIIHSATYGINDVSTAALVDYVRERQAEGKTVYYHYTEYEDVKSRFRRYELGFNAYFAAVQREFSVQELVRSSSAERVQRIYAIEPSMPGG